MMTAKLDQLLGTWETNYKKGLLTFWLLLALHDRACYAFEMSERVAELSLGSMTADGNSIYRALGRFEEMGLVESAWRGSAIGPDRRYYHLTTLGHDLLKAFIQRNLLLFQEAAVRDRVQRVLALDPASMEGHDGSG